MPKNIVEDVVPPEKRSIRSIQVNRNTNTATPRTVETTVETSTTAEEPVYKIPSDIGPAPQRTTETTIETHRVTPPPIVPKDSDDAAWREIDRELNEKPSMLPRYITGFVVIVLIILGVFIISGFFTSATIAVTPRVEQANVNVTLDGEEMASSTINSLALSENGTTTAIGATMEAVPYQIVSFSENVSKTVPATGTQNIQTKASGTITIYNDFGTAPQKLVTNTRFETPEGLIYRINAPVTIPGMVGTTPGSIAVTVYADAAGPSYNIGLTNFTIPGFASNAAEFKGFYAKSKTAMQGGASGVVSVASPADVASAKTAVESQLHTDLVKQAEAAATADSTVYPNLLPITYQIVNSSSASATSTVAYTESGTLNAVFFDTDALASSIAAKSLSDYDGSSVRIPQLGSLNAALEDPKSASGVLGNGGLTVTITGNSSFIWNYSAADLKAALAGKSKDVLPQVLSTFPQITKAEAVIHPFWKNSFPSDTSKITVTTDNPNL